MNAHRPGDGASAELPPPVRGGQKSGLPEVEALPWGSHICQLYRDRQDLISTLVPFFAAGLESNERCLWITSQPLDAKAARAALSAVIDDLEQREQAGQIDIIEHHDWYLRHGQLGAEEVIQSWLEREALARSDGYAGLRLSGNTSWLDDSSWSSFVSYETCVHEAFRDRHVIALCSYALAKCDPARIGELMQNHVLALTRHDDGWRVLRADCSERGHAELDGSVLGLRALRSESAMRAQNESAEHIAQLQRLTSALSEVSSTAGIAALVVGELEGLFDARAAAFALASDDGSSLELIAHAGLSPEQQAELRGLGADAPLALARAYRSGTPVWLTGDETRDDPLASGAHSLACLPLWVRGRRLGAIGLAHERERVPSALRRALLDGYAKQVALAIERARSHDDAARARNRFQLLADASSRIAQAKLDLDQIVDTVAREVIRASFAQRCGINLKDEAGALPLLAFHCVDAAVTASIVRTLNETPIESGKGLIGKVARSGESVRTTSIEETAAATRDEYLDLLRAHPINSVVVVPLRASGEVIGTLTASRQPPHPSFTAEDQQLLQDLADRTALSIENAKLYQRANRERERAERERQRAESANRAKDEFLAMLGHELRNPLSPILTAVQLMRLRAGDMLEKERTIIERQVNHMVRLVDDLLNISRITRGKVDLKRTPVELAQVVANAIEIASPLLEERSHSLVTQVPSSGLVVKADPARLAQLVANLLTNAAKYTPEGGHVEIIASRRGDSVKLSVRDDGTGIAPELLPNIFDLFVQGGQDIDRAQGGLGLGLAIAHRFAEMHGGKLTAHSDGPGMGSEFSLELPLNGNGARAREAIPAQASLSTGHGRRVLVVDDNTDAADVLADALSSVGFAVRVAHDGPSALAVADDFRPEVALLDIGLPVMDGYELARRLALTYGDAAPKLIAVTGYGQENDRRRSHEAGFSEHLVKPLDFTRLRQVLAASFPA